MDRIIVVSADAGLTRRPDLVVPLTAHFYFTITDPFAVTLTLTAKDQPIPLAQTTWMFARDLLDTALSSGATSGVGDVQVAYDAAADLLLFRLRDVHGVFHDVVVDGEPAARFITQTLDVAPLTVEYDVEAAIAAFDEWGRQR